MMLNYRAPLVAGLLLAAGLGWWTVLERRAFEQRHRAELERFVDGALLALDASHNVLRPLAGRPGRSGLAGSTDQPPVPPPRRPTSDLEPLIQVMERMVEVQKRIRWIAILTDGQVVARAGPVPASLAISGGHGERIEDGLFLAWRLLGAPLPRLGLDSRRGADRRRNGPQNLPGRVGPGGQEPGVPGRRPPPPDAPIAVVALDALPPPTAGHKDTLQIVQKIGTAALGVVALLVAWVLGIRSRALTTRLEAERVRRAHLEELSLAASGLAHETKNPLGIIRGLAQRMEQDHDLGEGQRGAARQILEEADRAVSRLGEFMTYARVRAPEPASVNARQLLEKAADVLAADLEAAGVRVRIEATATRVVADEEMLLQVLLNLMLNSLEASPPDREIILRLESTGSQATLTVADQGRGMAPELADRVFQPYVTGRSGGHGLGLAIVKRLIERHGWTIDLHTQPDVGTTVTVSGIRTAQPAGGTS